MKVEQVFSDRKRFLDLLLLADEQEDMIDRYLERGDMFALYDEDKLRADKCCDGKCVSRIKEYRNLSG